MPWQPVTGSPRWRPRGSHGPARAVRAGRGSRATRTRTSRRQHWWCGRMRRMGPARMDPRQTRRCTGVSGCGNYNISVSTASAEESEREQQRVSRRESPVTHPMLWSPRLPVKLMLESEPLTSKTPLFARIAAVCALVEGPATACVTLRIQSIARSSMNEMSKSYSR